MTLSFIVTSTLFLLKNVNIHQHHQRNNNDFFRHHHQQLLPKSKNEAQCSFGLSSNCGLKRKQQVESGTSQMMVSSINPSIYDINNHSSKIISSDDDRDDNDELLLDVAVFNDIDDDRVSTYRESSWENSYDQEEVIPNFGDINSSNSTYHQKHDDRHDEDVDKVINYYNHGDYDDAYSGFPHDGESNSNNRNNNNNDIDSNKFSSNHDYRRCNAQMATGRGKTLFSLQVLSSLFRNGIGPEQKILRTVLYVVPYLSLADQVLDHCDNFDILRDIPHERLIVASQTNRTENRTTNPDIIANFLSSSSSIVGDDNKLRLLACTYHSLPKVGQALKLLTNNSDSHFTGIDFAIFDEAHCMTGAGKRYGYGLYDENLHIGHRLFLTATPKTYSKSVKEVRIIGQKLNERDGSNKLIPKRDDDSSVDSRRRSDARSFDDESLFGPCIAKRSYEESVQEKLVVPLKLCYFDNQEVSKALGVPLDDLESTYDTNVFALQCAMQKLNVTRVVSFHSRNARAETFVDQINSHKDDNHIVAVSIDHTMNVKTRKEKLLKAKNAPKASVVANHRLLSIGVDEASWDLVFLADPISSVIEAKQRIGRVCRMDLGKEYGYVLVPDLDYGFSIAFQAMVMDNPDLRRDVIFVNDESKRLGRPLTEEDYPQTLRDTFVLPAGLTPHLRQDVMARAIVDANTDITSNWDRNYEFLVAYKEREGHCNTPQKHMENGIKLGSWLNTQKQMKKAGILDSFRRQKLEEIGVVWDVLEHQWENMFSLLAQYKQREGHCNVPQTHQEAGENLGIWLKNQRKDKLNGKLMEKEQQLEEIGVVWDVFEYKWEKMFSLLVQYKQREGHCNVPAKHKEDDESLGTWLSNQRAHEKKGKLDREKEKLLEQIGVRWDVLEYQWEKMLALLVQYKQREGHCNVPAKHKEDGENLGTWLSRQRKNKKKGKLDLEKEQRLEEIGVIWQIRQKQKD